MKRDCYLAWAALVGWAGMLAANGAGRPNILFLLADDQRADTIAAHGNPHIRTPNLDRLAASGFSFRANYCFGGNSGAVCMPSRAMLMSGKTWFHVDNSLTNAVLMPEVLARSGYVTFATGKWHNGPASWLRAFQRGSRVFLGGMSDHTRVPVRDLGPDGKLTEPRPGERFSSEMFADAAIEFLRSHDGTKPFFAYVAFTAPHDPRMPPERYRQMYYRDRPPLPGNFLPQHPFDNGMMRGGRDENLAPWPRTEAVVRDQLAEYYGLITHLDEQVGRILEALRESGHSDDTLIIYAADQGLAVGSHGLLGKQSVYEHSMRCPLILAGPGIPAGRSTDAFSYLLDVFPTVCDVLGIEPPGDLDGASLRPIWEGVKSRIRDSVFLPFLEIQRAVRDDRWKLIAYPKIGHLQLFDLESDPLERINVIDRAENAGHVDRLRALMKEWQRKAGDRVELPAENRQPAAIDLSGQKRDPDPWQPDWIVNKYFRMGPPNILLAIADDWSFGHAGAYGCRWVRTPAFDRVAREGILFTHAYTPNAKCAPSRACLLTGRNSWQLEAACNHSPFFPPRYRTYPEILAERGWHVGVTAKGWAPGVATNADGRPRQLAGQPYNQRTAPPPAQGIGRNDYAANFADFLDAAPTNTPWCFWYGAVEPHRGYEFGSGTLKGGKRIEDVDWVPGYWPDNEVVRQDLLDYAFEVEHFDRHLGRMLDELERRGLLDQTLVVATSDHGMPFPRAKGQAYDESNHVPLAIRWKRGIASPGRVVDDYVSFIDLAPTFIDVARLDWAATGLASTPGRSLRDIFESAMSGRVNPGRDHALIGKERHDVGRPHDWGYPIRGIVRDGWLYVRNFETARWPAGNPETGYLNCDGGPTKTEILDAHRRNPADPPWALCFGRRPAAELYDLRADPDCLRNRSGDPMTAALEEDLRRRMSAELEAQGDPRILGRGEVFEQYPYSSDKDRGFYERYMRGEKLSAGWVSPTDFEKGHLDSANALDKPN